MPKTFAQRYRCFVTILATLSVSVCFLGAGAQAEERTRIKVASYEFGVVFFYDEDARAGMAPYLVSVLNEMQDKYVFEFHETSSRRRYLDLTSGEMDIVLLESPTWEWPDYNVKFSDPIVSERDLYVARKGQSNVASMFANVTDHSLLAVLGFHYAFGDFNSDPQYLNENFDVLLRYNEKEVLNDLLAGQGDLGVISAGFLAREFERNPDLRDQLILGPADSTYNLVSIISDDAPISLAEFNEFVAKLKKDAQIGRYWRQLHGDVSG
ncbi:MAG: transporter substrate-binding domain-containing protein [Thalassospira sp.]|uniref:transporter substrate-binding domain-containing protein n=1 Tax=Thalassospira sp. TaxID=1912094 RepID=UPI0032EFCC9F